MRSIAITEECLEFVYAQDERVAEKFFYVLEVISEIKVVHTNFVKKLQSSRFYELRLKTGNEYRIIVFAIDNLNFTEYTKAICLNGFVKKSARDYARAIRQAERLLAQYNINNQHQ